MKIKVNFFDKKVRKKFYSILSLISVIVSIVLAFISISEEHKIKMGVLVLALLALFVFIIIIYISIWIYANKLQNIKLMINNSEVEVKFGNFFDEVADWKVISFNEYFDTLVDDKIIAKSSMNGKFIEKCYKEKLEELDNAIAADSHLSSQIVCENTNRSVGKKTKYKLGTICVVNGYLLTAFTHFDDENRAYLEMIDYISCLLNFWTEIDRVYAGKTVVLSVMGSGITRFRGYDNISDQELLELIIWTFKVSRVKFAYPSKVKIVVFSEKSDKINLMALKDLE
jgi:hypothetical protein